MKVSKATLIEKLAADPRNEGVSKKQLDQTASSLFDAVLDSLEDPGDAVYIRGFGTFTTVAKDATIKRNPRSGEPVSIPAQVVRKFRFPRGVGSRPA